MPGSGPPVKQTRWNMPCPAAAAAVLLLLRRRSGTRQRASATWTASAFCTLTVLALCLLPQGVVASGAAAGAAAAGGARGGGGAGGGSGGGGGGLGDASAASKHVDLIEALQLWNTTYAGLTVIPGPRPFAPAVFLQGESREVQVPDAVQRRAASLLSNTREFTVTATIQQEDRNAGTILAFSRGSQRFLELQSSGRKDEIRLHYIYGGSIHVETFPFRLADQRWHKVAVMVSGSQVEVWVDCARVYRRLAPPPMTNFTALAALDLPLDPLEPGSPPAPPESRDQPVALFLGQRNAKHFLFKGALQDVRVIGHAGGHLQQCPQAEAECPTCGQFQQLADQVNALQSLVSDLAARLTASEARLAAVEECDCQRSCRVNGTIRQDGATWKSGCEICSCVHGEVTCRPIPCPAVTCKNPVYTEGECCPVCLKQCSLKGVVYDHGETVSPRQCVDCECRDGKMQCRRVDPALACPPLPCPEEEQFSVPDQCCKFCPGVDYCAHGHDCHANATCINLQATYTCHCNQGFTGDGRTCTDLDECSELGGHHGHHCQAHTRCVNTPGSYVCECESGYVRHDELTCVEQDECREGAHLCHEHATCTNTRGSYHCKCKEGYSGDGFTCTPICNNTCVNGGWCAAPGLCECRRGFTGRWCELDVDECALGLHHCHSASRCVNMPGWYMCQCLPGYTSLLAHGSQAVACRDVDECHSGTATCHASATCVNTEGSFSCTCDNTTSCSLACVVDGEEKDNGDVWTPEGSPCAQCVCNEGRVTCDRFMCDCSDPRVNVSCCPHCDPRASCSHQQEAHVSFRSGQRWIYQCQTCECLYGEVDCWPLECPPPHCENPQHIPGDCCLRCPDDPCAAPSATTAAPPSYNTSLALHQHPGGSTSPSPSSSSSSTSSSSTSSSQDDGPQGCHYLGALYPAGAEWAALNDHCVTCRCQAGHICCTYRHGCPHHRGTTTIPSFAPAYPPNVASRRGLALASRRSSSGGYTTPGQGGGGGGGGGDHLPHLFHASGSSPPPYPHPSASSSFAPPLHTGEQHAGEGMAVAADNISVSDGSKLHADRISASVDDASPRASSVVAASRNGEEEAAASPSFLSSSSSSFSSPPTYIFPASAATAPSQSDVSVDEHSQSVSDLRTSRRHEPQQPPPPPSSPSPPGRHKLHFQHPLEWIRSRKAQLFRERFRQLQQRSRAAGSR
ncbi:protein kinase C-binding protein NELL1-like isoform X1 [Oratosquilla oratoria]|uniref:protein kinase C-binding protein NELL1-like isoform X1 n=1 Tax=Oratosquilla oratoria TaxID=337810 RepID=UPI003F75A160